jgi:hypothetical protein
MNQAQSEKETLTFKIGLSGTYWDRPPRYTVLIDKVKVAEGFAEKEVSYIEFSHDLEDDKSHSINIRLENKTLLDVVESEDKTTIIKDMLLNIESISIDDVELGQLMWDKSKFVGDEPNRPVLSNCVNLGWNGTYTLEFSCPFYLWLLENM